MPVSHPKNLLIKRFGLTRGAVIDVYNMQLSNEPAEELARMLVDSGKGAFELCGFFAGGETNIE